MIYRKLVIVMAVLVGCLTSCSTKVDDLACPYSDGTYVLDPDGYFSLAEKTRMDQIGDKLRKESDLETAIVILDRIDGDIFDFSLNLYNRWGLGHNDRGLLLVVAVGMREWQFISGYGAEAEFPDALLSRIGNTRFTERFRGQDYGGGVIEAFEDIYKISTNSFSEWDALSYRDPARKGHFVFDDAHRLSVAQRDSVDRQCRAMRDSLGLDLFFAIVSPSEDLDVVKQSYYSQWSVGKSGRGLLCLFCPESGQWRMVSGVADSVAVLPSALQDSVGQVALVPSLASADVVGAISAVGREVSRALREGPDSVRVASLLAKRAAEVRSAPESSSVAKPVSHEGSDYALTFVFLWLGVPFAGLYVAFYFMGDKPLREVKGRLVKERADGADFTVYVLDDHLGTNPGPWAKDSFVWFLLSPVVFSVGLWFCFEWTAFYDADVWKFVVFVFAFLGYNAILRVIKISMEVFGGELSPVDRYACASVGCSSAVMKFYAVVAPYVVLPFNFVMSRKMSALYDSFLSCPSCKAPLAESSVPYRPTSVGRLYEAEHGIVQARMRSCAAGHTTVILLGAGWSRRHYCCSVCGGYTLEEVRSDVVKEPTSTKTGVCKVTYECLTCSKKMVRNEVVPVLSSAMGSSFSNSSSSSSGGSYGSSSGGWSSSGGSSGGGGARGSW